MAPKRLGPSGLISNDSLFSENGKEKANINSEQPEIIIQELNQLEKVEQTEEKLETTEEKDLNVIVKELKQLINSLKAELPTIQRVLNDLTKDEKSEERIKKLAFKYMKLLGKSKGKPQDFVDALSKLLDELSALLEINADELYDGYELERIRVDLEKASLLLKVISHLKLSQELEDVVETLKSIDMALKGLAAEIQAEMSKISLGMDSSKLSTAYLEKCRKELERLKQNLEKAKESMQKIERGLTEIVQQSVVDPTLKAKLSHLFSVALKEAKEAAKMGRSPVAQYEQYIATVLQSDIYKDLQEVVKTMQPYLKNYVRLLAEIERQIMVLENEVKKVEELITEAEHELKAARKPFM